MSDDARLARIESDVAEIKGMLKERCASREVRLVSVETKCANLQSCEDQRKGGMAVLAAVASGGAVIGGMVVKFFPRLGG